MSIDSNSSAKRLNLERATNFMRQFRDPDSRELKKLSANQFMEVWSHYDRDVPLSILAQLTELDPCVFHACPVDYWPWCEVMNGTVRCICILEYYRTRPICKPTCTIDSECDADRTCSHNRCGDLCPGFCGTNAQCDVINHKPICSCPPGYSGDPFIRCHNMHQVPLQTLTPCIPSPCGPYSQCEELNGIPVCRCLPNSIGFPPSCTQKCTNNSECNEVMACINNRCSDPYSACGNDAQCSVHNHIPYCSCLSKAVDRPPAVLDCQIIHEGNGYIEGTELDGFLKEFVSSANFTDISPDAVSDEMLVELKACFMEAYDDNQDGKIDIRELAQLLPMEENFLLLFRFDNPLESSVEFMKIWREYDTDGSGYIEADELKNFLRDLLKEAKKINDVSEDKLIEYTDTMLQVFDSNKDGRLQLSEMAKLLPVKENFLCRQVFKEGIEGATKLTKDDIERVFSLYDRDNNGSIENEELRGFLKDLLELVKKDYDAQDLLEFEETILQGVEYSSEGKISRKQLTMILLALAKHHQEEEPATP